MELIISLVLILILSLLRCHITRGQIPLVNNYICGESYCEKYLETSGCDAVHVSCLAQNSTLNGILLPSQTPCSCCEFCLEHLKEGDDCTLGLIGAPVPSSVCGPHLTCTLRLELEEEHATCQYRTATTCLTNVQEFDSGMQTGELGHLMVKPDCSELGVYTAFRCIPGQICYCVDKNGERIFGEALNVPGMAILMRCQCARQELNSRQILGLRSSDNFIRCDEMGSYSRVLCLGEKCVCVDPHSGSPTSPQYNITNLDDLQKDWKCFEGNEEILQRECERYREKIRLQSSSTFMSNHDWETMCQPDGQFGRVQRNETHYFCADNFGIQIGNYGQLVEAQDKINCNCARVLNLLKKNNRIEFPQCCANGNYKRINCRRGYCYCVDDNGHQISVEVERHSKSQLSCFSDDPSSECN